VRVLHLLKYVAFGAVVAFMSACSSGPKPLYNYEEYNQSYYNLKKEPSADSTLAYQRALEEVINNKDESSSGRVPPGMYANLGYLYLKAGDRKNAVQNFKQEKSIYPEAAFFMDRMIKKIEAMESDDAE